MFRRIACPALAVLATAAIAAVTVGTAQGNEAPAGSNAGPPYNYVTELMGEGGPALPLKDQVLLTRTEHGYSYRTGQQNNHLVVTRVDGAYTFEGEVTVITLGNDQIKLVGVSAEDLIGNLDAYIKIV